MTSISAAVPVEQAKLPIEPPLSTTAPHKDKFLSPNAGLRKRWKHSHSSHSTPSSSSSFSVTPSSSSDASSSFSASSSYASSSRSSSSDSHSFSSSPSSSSSSHLDRSSSKKYDSYHHPHRHQRRLEDRLLSSGVDRGRHQESRSPSTGRHGKRRSESREKKERKATETLMTCLHRQNRELERLEEAVRQQQQEEVKRSSIRSQTPSGRNEGSSAGGRIFSSSSFPAAAAATAVPLFLPYSHSPVGSPGGNQADGDVSFSSVGKRGDWGRGADDEINRRRSRRIGGSGFLADPASRMSTGSYGYVGTSAYDPPYRVPYSTVSTSPPPLVSTPEAQRNRYFHRALLSSVSSVAKAPVPLCTRGTSSFSTADSSIRERYLPAHVHRMNESLTGRDEMRWGEERPRAGVTPPPNPTVSEGIKQEEEEEDRCFSLNRISAFRQALHAVPLPRSSSPSDFRKPSPSSAGHDGSRWLPPPSSRSLADPAEDPTETHRSSSSAEPTEILFWSGVKESARTLPHSPSTPHPLEGKTDLVQVLQPTEDGEDEEEKTTLNDGTRRSSSSSSSSSGSGAIGGGSAAVGKDGVVDGHVGVRGPTVTAHCSSEGGKVVPSEGKGTDGISREENKNLSPVESLICSPQRSVFSPPMIDSRSGTPRSTSLASMGKQDSQVHGMFGGTPPSLGDGPNINAMEEENQRVGNVWNGPAHTDRQTPHTGVEGFTSSRSFNAGRLMTVSAAAKGGYAPHQAGGSLLYPQMLPSGGDPLTEGRDMKPKGVLIFPPEDDEDGGSEEKMLVKEQQYGPLMEETVRQPPRAFFSPCAILSPSLLEKKNSALLIPASTPTIRPGRQPWAPPLMMGMEGDGGDGQGGSLHPSSVYITLGGMPPTAPRPQATLTSATLLVQGTGGAGGGGGAAATSSASGSPPWKCVVYAPEPKVPHPVQGEAPSSTAAASPSFTSQGFPSIPPAFANTASGNLNEPRVVPLSALQAQNVRFLPEETASTGAGGPGMTMGENRVVEGSTVSGTVEGGNNTIPRKETGPSHSGVAGGSVSFLSPTSTKPAAVFSSVQVVPPSTASSLSPSKSGAASLSGSGKKSSILSPAKGKGFPASLFSFAKDNRSSSPTRSMDDVERRKERQENSHSRGENGEGGTGILSPQHPLSSFPAQHSSSSNFVIPTGESEGGPNQLNFTTPDARPVVSTYPIPSLSPLRYEEGGPTEAKGGLSGGAGEGRSLPISPPLSFPPSMKIGKGSLWETTENVSQFSGSAGVGYPTSSSTIPLLTVVGGNGRDGEQPCGRLSDPAGLHTSYLPFEDQVVTFPVPPHYSAPYGEGGSAGAMERNHAGDCACHIGCCANPFHGLGEWFRHFFFRSRLRENTG